MGKPLKWAGAGAGAVAEGKPLKWAVAVVGVVAEDVAAAEAGAEADVIGATDVVVVAAAGCRVWALAHASKVASWQMQPQNQRLT